MFFERTAGESALSALAFFLCPMVKRYRQIDIKKPGCVLNRISNDKSKGASLAARHVFICN